MTLITFITGISRDFYRRLVRGEETLDRWRCLVCAGAQNMSVDEDLIPVPSDDDSLLQQERNASGRQDLLDTDSTADFDVSVRHIEIPVENPEE